MVKCPFCGVKNEKNAVFCDECGKKLNSNKMGWEAKFVVVVVILVVGIIGAAVYLLIDGIMVDSTSLNNKVFENQFIKFNYSSDLNMVDNSNNTTLNVTIYDGSVDPSNYQINAVGAIFVSNSINRTKTGINANKLKNVIISGYKAEVEYDQGDSGATIYLNDTAGLFVLLNPDHDSYVNTILNSFVVKKAPPKFTYFYK